MRATRYKILPYSSARYQPDPGKDFYQWWYFDAEFSSGHRFMTITLPRMLGNVEDHNAGQVPFISMVIMDPNHVNYREHEYFPGRFHGDPDRVGGRFGDNLVEFKDRRFRLHYRVGTVGVDLEYDPLLPPWPPLPGRKGFLSPLLLWMLAPGKFFHYASFVPRGTVTGRLIYPGNEVEVEGVGYFEQGRSNTAIPTIFRSWYWIRFFIDDWTFIFPVAVVPDPLLKTRKVGCLLIYHGEECVADMFDPLGLFLKMNMLEYDAYAPAKRNDVPRRCVFMARAPGLRLKVDMHLGHTLEAFCWHPFHMKTTRQPAWMQHEMDVAVDLRLKKQNVKLEGKGIFETMLCD